MKKRFLAVILALALCVGLAPAAFAAESDFVIEDGVLTEYNGPGGDVVIPDGVVCIGDGAFKDCTSMTSVIIPDSVDQIGYYHSMYGGDGAFEGCTGLTSVTIPGSVTYLGCHPFSGCTSLTSLTFPVSVETIDPTVFLGTKTDIYYEGSQDQWNKIDVCFISLEDSTTRQIGTINSIYEDPANWEMFEDWEKDFAMIFLSGIEGGITIHYNSARAKFTDLSPTGFYLDAVAWAVEKNVTTGTTATTFSPGKTCTHGQILTFLWRAADKPESNAQPPIAMKGDEFYYKAVKWAAEKGMIGRDFAPEAGCTRADAVNYIWQAFGKPAAAYDGRFTDVPAGSPYATAIAWALANEVTTGATATTFSPAKICNRGEIVTFLYRAYK